ncbi:MAG: GNAT family N-acetyltransferase [Prevotella sp.]|nr:GNAT family N-acetyltransferase [Prevotella sp.]
MEPEDLQLLYTIENDRQLWCIGTANVPYSRYLLRDFIERQTGDIYTDRQVRLMVENTQGEVVGMADLTDFNPSHQRAEVGIVVLRSHQGKGYGAAALQQLENYARETLHLHQLYAIVPVAHTVSVSLFARLGYTTNTTLHEWLHNGAGYQDALLMQKLLLPCE